MRFVTIPFAAVVLSVAALPGCGGDTGTSTTPTQTQTAAPHISASSNFNLNTEAVVVALGSATPGSIIYYSLDGSTPTPNSMRYEAPFLVASNLTIKAIAQAPGDSVSNVISQTFTPNVPSGTLVWSDEFANSTGANAQPNPQVWTYDTGPGINFGNHELEVYCAWGSNASPCNSANANAYEDTGGILHIVARQPTGGVYTSARLKTQGLFSFQYGRIEARMKLPEGQGMWPAFWLLGNNIATIDWPACGELDVMEHINGNNPQNEGFDWVQGTIHGTGLSSGIQYHPAGFSAADWHSYGMIWRKGQIEFYVDDPASVYATFTPSTPTGTWPFDAGPQFILLNLAVGGDWPGAPDASTVFPSEIQVDYVRVYTN